VIQPQNALKQGSSLSDLLILNITKRGNFDKSSYAFPFFSWILSFFQAPLKIIKSRINSLRLMMDTHTQSILPENIVALNQVNFCIIAKSLKI